MHHQMTVHDLIDYISRFVLLASIVSALLPPFEWFAAWPNFMNIYKIFKMTIARWAAFNINSSLYPQTQSTSNAATDAKTPDNKAADALAMGLQEAAAKSDVVAQAVDKVQVPEVKP